MPCSTQHMLCRTSQARTVRLWKPHSSSLKRHLAVYPSQLHQLSHRLKAWDLLDRPRLTLLISPTTTLEVLWLPQRLKVVWVAQQILMPICCTMTMLRLQWWPMPQSLWLAKARTWIVKELTTTSKLLTVSSTSKTCSSSSQFTIQTRSVPLKPLRMWIMEASQPLAKWRTQARSTKTWLETITRIPLSSTHRLKASWSLITSFSRSRSKVQLNLHQTRILNLLS